MSLIQNLSLRQTVSALAIGSIMIVGGCKSKNGDANEVSDATVSISQKNFGDIGVVLNVPTRKVSEDESEKALKALGLWTESKAIKWAERSGREGTYTFKNISSKSKGDQTFNAKRITFAGLHMDGDRPVADRINMRGLTLKGVDGSVKIANLGLTDVELSKNIGALAEVDGLLDFADLDLESGADEGGPKGPKSAVLSGVSGQSDEAKFSISKLGWGQDPKTSDLRFAAQDLSITVQGDQPMAIRLDSANITGVGADADADFTGLQAGIVDFFSQGQGFGDVDIQGLNIDSDVFELSLPTLTQSVKEKGKIMQADFDMPALTVAVVDNGKLSPEAAQGVAVLNSLGFDQLVFSSQGQTEINSKTDLMTIKAVSLDLKEGFDLNYKGKVSGIGAMKKLGAEASAADIKAVEENIKIHDFAFSLEDKSIVERGFQLAGDMTGQKPENLRRQATGVLAIGSLAALTQSDGALYGELTKALSDFMQEGGTLNIALDPQTPLTLSDFDALTRGKKPDLKRLGFSASTTR